MIRWIDVEGFDGCVANAVSADGLVAGVALDKTGRVHGFLLPLRESQPRILDVGATGDTFFQDVAQGGIVIGDWTDGKRSDAFTWLGGITRPLKPPGAVEAWAGGILVNGDCCGAMRDATGRRVGFRRLGGRFEEVLPAGAESAVLHGIGDGGDVVGACSASGEMSGFLQRADNSVEWLDPPRGAFVASDCAAAGTWVVGWFSDREGLCTAGELRDGRWRTIDVPGGPWVESAAVGCCPGVGIAGWVLGGDGRKRGFVLDEP